MKPLILLCLLITFHASAFDRFALVIGNQNYQHAPLKHALNDARAMSDTFRQLGFAVTTVTDARADAMKSKVVDFFQQVGLSSSADKVAIVYYAGHAIQIDHVNYLVPIGIEFDDHHSFIANLFNLTELFALMEQSEGQQNIVILDACRNNPFEGLAGETLASGLAPVKAPSGTLIAFATEPGGVASDGRSNNGIYTKHLLHFIKQNLTVEEVFKKVRSKVARETRNRQIPWEHSSLLREVFFNPPKNKDLPDIVVF